MSMNKCSSSKEYKVKKHLRLRSQALWKSRFRMEIGLEWLES